MVCSKVFFLTHFKQGLSLILSKIYAMNFLSYSLLTIVILCFACSPEPNTEQETKAVSAVDEVEEPSFEIMNAESVFLTISNPDAVIGEFEKSAGSNEMIQAFISVDNSNEVLISHVSHEGQPHLLFEKAHDLLQLELTYLDDKVVEPKFRVSIRFKVKDYKTWKWLYDGDQKNRDNAGMVLVQMGTVKGDSNDVFMIFAIPDIAKAKEMMQKPSLLNKMKQGGVLGSPEINFWRLAGTS